MKNKLLLSLAILCLLAPACAVSPEGKEAEATVIAQKTHRAALGPTAVFQTAVSARLTADAPPASNTPTVTPDHTPTATSTEVPSPTPSPEPTDQAALQPTSENPWILQAECETNPLCSYIEVTNKTPGWFQIELVPGESGESGFFSVRSQGIATIHMSRGEYWANMTWYCSGEAYSQRRWLPANSNFTMLVKCPSTAVQVKNIPQ